MGVAVVVTVSKEGREYGGFAVMLAIEAINSVAIEHAPDCTCVVCRAADGDTHALAEIMVAIHDARQ